MRNRINNIAITIILLEALIVVAIIGVSSLWFLWYVFTEVLK